MIVTHNKASVSNCDKLVVNKDKESRQLSRKREVLAALPMWRKMSVNTKYVPHVLENRAESTKFDGIILWGLFALCYCSYDKRMSCLPSQGSRRLLAWSQIRYCPEALFKTIIMPPLDVPSIFPFQRTTPWIKRIGQRFLLGLSRPPERCPLHVILTSR